MLFPNIAGAWHRGWIAAFALALATSWTATASAQLADEFDIDELTEIAPPVTTPPAEGQPGTTPGEGEAAAEGETISGEELFNQAEQLRSEEKYAEAIQAYLQITNEAPQYAPAWLGIAKSYAALEEYSAAIEALNSASRYSRDLEVIVERGRIQLEAGNYEAALQDFEVAVQTQPTNPELLFLRGKTQLRVARALAQENDSEYQEFIPQAVSSLDRAIKYRDDHAASYYERGSAYTMAGNTEDALSDFQKAIELDSTEPNYKAQFGFVHLRRASELERRPNVDPERLVNHYRSAIDAMGQFLQAKPVQGRTEYRQGLKELEPDDVPVTSVLLQRAAAFTDLASLLPPDERAPLYEQGIADCNRVLELEESATGAMFQRAVLERVSGDLDKALATLHDAVQLDAAQQRGASPELLLRRGIIYYHMGDLSLALQDFEQSHANSPMADGRAAFWQGVVHARQGDVLEAIRLYTAAIRENPQYMLAYNNRALAFMTMGDYERAIQDFDRVLLLDGGNRTIQERRDQAARLLAGE